MITRVYRGHHTAGLVAYLYGPGRHEEHRDQHLVACWDGNTSVLEPAGFNASALAEGEVRQHALAIARALDLPLPACAHDPQHVYHLVLRNPAADRVLTDAEWAQVARDMMDRTGIAPAGDDLGCRWVLVRHGEDHVHLVATLARQDGRRPRVFNDFAKLRACAREWEARLGLTGTAGVDRTAAGAPTIAETKKTERLAAAAASTPAGPGARHAATGGTTTWKRSTGETPKVRLARAVQTAAARSHDLPSFQQVLGEAGVQVHLRYSTQRPEEVTGVSFSVTGHVSAAGDPIRYSGSKLAPDLSWRHLQARWTTAPTAGTDTSHRAGPGRADTASGAQAGGEAGWQDAEAIVRSAADRIRADHTGPGDPDGADSAGSDDADDAAWAAADVAFGFAWFMEGARGGWHTSAAAAMARAGRVPGAARPVSSPSGRALRGLARTLSTHRGRRSDPGARRLVAAMSDLAAAVAQRRAAQARLEQAQAAQAARTTYQQLRTRASGPGFPTTPGLRPAAAPGAQPGAQPGARPGTAVPSPRAWPPRPRDPGSGGRSR